MISRKKSLSSHLILMVLTFGLAVSGYPLGAWAQAPVERAPLPTQQSHPAPAATGAPVSTALSSDESQGAVQNYYVLKSKQVQSSANPQTSVRANGSHQGVAVHGHWVIDVKNPDGSLAHHYDFENALQSTGQHMLTFLLTGQFVPSDYMIFLNPPVGQQPICSGPGLISQCGLIDVASIPPAVEQCDLAFGTVCQSGLVIGYTAAGANQLFTSMTLAGSFTATQLGQIGTVDTVFGGCSAQAYSSLSNATCVAFNTPATQNYFTGILTQAQPPVITVFPNQIVVVTVTITLS
jgi:hypothetical protein